MRANFAFGCPLFMLWACLALLGAAGCGDGAAPVQTSPDAIDQFLQENPEEAYTSDGIVEEMEEDDGEG